MGYDTTFKGCFRVVPNFEPSHEAYLTQFGYTRRMKRNSFMAAELPDPERLAVGLPLGWEGGYFTGGQGFRGQNADPSIVDYNRAPEGQPLASLSMLGLDHVGTVVEHVVEKLLVPAI